MEKVRFGLIGIGAQGGAYAGFYQERVDFQECRHQNARRTVH